MRAWLVKLLGGADPDDARIAYGSAEYWHNSYRELEKANVSLRQESGQLREEKAQLVRNYRLLRDQFNAANPAPNDSEWQKRFAELDKEYTAFANDHYKALQENGDMKRRLAAWDTLLEKIRG
jgi:hypothetical protein